MHDDGGVELEAEGAVVVLPPPPPELLLCW
jgi:hypothetical protein